MGVLRSRSHPQPHSCEGQWYTNIWRGSLFFYTRFAIYVVYFHSHWSERGNPMAQTRASDVSFCDSWTHSGYTDIALCAFRFRKVRICLNGTHNETVQPRLRGDTHIQFSCPMRAFWFLLSIRGPYSSCIYEFGDAFCPVDCEWQMSVVDEDARRLCSRCSRSALICSFGKTVQFDSMVRGIWSVDVLAFDLANGRMRQVPLIDLFKNIFVDYCVKYSNTVEYKSFIYFDVTVEKKDKKDKFAVD